MVKVKEINLERGWPTVDQAVRDMVGQLGACRRQGYRALILIHGYGSSGTGGGIRAGIRSKLKEKSLCGLVSSWCGGEDWINRKQDLVNCCPHLKQFEQRISDNQGVTVVLLK